MATVPTFTTFVAGTVLTAAQLNSNVRDAGNFFLNPPYVDLTNVAGVSTTTAVATLMPWDTELADTDNMHSVVTNPSRVTFQTLGLYLINLWNGWPTSTTGGKQNQIRLNSAGSSSGGTQLQNRTAQGSTIGGTGLPSFSWTYRAANIGDYIEVFVTQNTGATVTTNNTSGQNGIQVLWMTA